MSQNELETKPSDKTPRFRIRHDGLDLKSGQVLKWLPTGFRVAGKYGWLLAWLLLSLRTICLEPNGMSMWNKISLKSRIYLLLAGLVLITLTGGLVLNSYTYRMEVLLNSIIYNDLKAFHIAEALEMALVNQKGYLSYYFMDGDPGWLRQLGKYRQIFKERMDEITAGTETAEEKNIIQEIQTEYQTYIDLKDRVIGYYKNDEKESGVALHKKTREHFFKILNLCREYKQIYSNKIIEAGRLSHEQAKKLRIISLTAMLTGFFLVICLVFVLAKQILEPVKQLTLKADRKEDARLKGDEITALSRSVNKLIEDVDYSHEELQKSREHLLQAEKMALVGKLAAGMAHSIRNPFTSVKMRLFSLNRSLQLSSTQKEDFDVISEEIRHIDTIVQNFLEFSRPPRLQLQHISPSRVVDSAIQLLSHRLKSYKVAVEVARNKELPRIYVDPDQLKEVLVNLVVNACEAMEDGGIITIEERETVSPNGTKMAVITVIDNGPGIPESLQDKVLLPFFTTKAEGTGLGLSIVKRIIEEHNGRLDIISKEGEGAAFVISLYTKEKDLGNHFDN